MSISIVKAVPQDINFIKNLEVEGSLSTWSKEDYLSEIVRKDSIFLVAQRMNQRLGFLLARLILFNEKPDTGNIAEIYNIAIQKSQQRKGIGQSLLNELIRIAGKRNVHIIHLEVRKSNQNALDFYRKSGFIITGERKNFYRSPAEDAVLMQIALPETKIQ